MKSNGADLVVTFVILFLYFLVFTVLYYPLHSL